MGEVVLEVNMVLKYFADRQHTEQLLRNIEKTINKRCFYCGVCDLCKKFTTYRLEFKQRGFWTFHKDIKYWNVYDPDCNAEKTFFRLKPIKADNFKM